MILVLNYHDYYCMSVSQVRIGLGPVSLPDSIIIIIANDNDNNNN